MVFWRVLPLAVVLLAACGDGSSSSSTSTSTSGSGGHGGGASSQSAAASSSVSSAGGSTSSSAAAGSSSSSGGDGSSKCATAGLQVCEGFEGAAVGGFPTGWGKRNDTYGGKSIGVAADAAARGTHSLKVEGGESGQQFMEYKGMLANLATTHFGRVFLKVQTPAPWPSANVLHGDFIEGLGPHPGGGTNNVRWGIVENTQMKFQWIYNVQPSQGEPEFGEGTDYVYTWTGQWQCIEWYYDQPSQKGTLWIDGAEIPITPGKSHAAEIPVFTSLGVGFANYQVAPSGGFVVWLDEVAFDPERIGCDKLGQRRPAPCAPSAAEEGARAGLGFRPA